MAVRATGWVVHKVCKAQERVSDAINELTAARIDLCRLSDKIDGEDFTSTELYRDLERLGNELTRIENELEHQIRDVATLIPESREGGIE